MIELLCICVCCPNAREWITSQVPVQCFATITIQAEGGKTCCNIEVFGIGRTVEVSFRRSEFSLGIACALLGAYPTLITYNDQLDSPIMTPRACSLIEVRIANPCSKPGRVDLTVL